MNSEKWKQAKHLYETAQKLGPDEQSRFLAENCGDDEELRLEVESLLACSDEAGGFLEKPAVGELAEIIVSQRSLAGKKILQYNIIDLLGSGGMGEVYLAEDTRLKRKIALKILPPSLSENKGFVQRFEREACAASALNHPNILTVHEIGEKGGVNFIASELVKGETLRERIESGNAMDLEETLGIVLQVAAALRAAHASSIIHRDIKPENVMIRDDGLVKVLDFGLAKLTGAGDGEVNSYEDTLVNTMPGMIMGTTGYMSPEQARGHNTDARTDIWSLGIILYEMLAGTVPFKGETASDTMASILVREPPPLDNLPADLTAILEKTLQKDANERYQEVKHLIRDLETFQSGMALAPVLTGSGRRLFGGEDTVENRPASDTDTVIEARWRPSAWKWPAVFAFLVVVAVGAILIPRLSSNQERPIVPNDVLENLNTRTKLEELDTRKLREWNVEAGEDDTFFRFSREGTMIAYSFTKDGRSNIWIQQVPEGNPIQITHGDRWDYYNPVWSPDGERIAYLTNKDGKLGIWTMPFSGGAATFVEAAETEKACLLQWSRDGNKIYLQEGDPRSGLNVFAIDLVSKTPPAKVTNFDPSSRAQFFNISPDEDRIAYSAVSNGGFHIFVVSMTGGTPEQVTNDSEASDEYPYWLPDGKRIIYSAKRNRIFQPTIVFLDKNHQKQQINLSNGDALIQDVALKGGRVLLKHSQEWSDIWKIGIDGIKDTKVTSEPGLELCPEVSKDGQSIVFQSTSESKHLLESSINICSSENQNEKPGNITRKGFSPSFSPGGQKVAFLRNSGTTIDLWTIGRDGTDEQRLASDIWFAGFTDVPYNRVQVKDFRWSSDGTSLLFCAKKDGFWNVWLAAADGRGIKQISNNSDENMRLFSPAFAADGKIAWTSLPEQPSPDGSIESALHLWNGESTEVLYSSKFVVKLVGWAENSLVIAEPDDMDTSEPVDVSLRMISTAKIKSDMAMVKEVYFNNIQLSPDGRRVALATREGGKDNIRTVSVPGGGSRLVRIDVDQTTYISGITWSPDGKTIYFSKQRGVGSISMIENFK
jgi:serine/threonine protein kinase/Tol biopolymer transport system component